jgi:hypothetical protein
VLGERKRHKRDIRGERQEREIAGRERERERDIRERERDKNWERERERERERDIERHKRWDKRGRLRREREREREREIAERERGASPRTDPALLDSLAALVADLVAVDDEAARLDLADDLRHAGRQPDHRPIGRHNRVRDLDGCRSEKELLIV